MSREVVSTVSYDSSTASTVLLGVDFQLGFGARSWEPVPHAATAVENFRVASAAWRAAGGTVVHLQTSYTADRRPTGRITDFAPDIAEALAAGGPAAARYPGLVEAGDLVIDKTSFSAVLSSDLVEQLRGRGIDTARASGRRDPAMTRAEGPPAG